MTRTTKPKVPQPQRYRKRPVTIMAMRLPVEGTTEPAQREYALALGGLAGWLHWLGADFQMNDGKGLDLVTPEGTMRANPGDYIVRGIQGEVYPIKPDVFEATYELVQETKGE